jgi:hypothetical protein
MAHAEVIGVNHQQACGGGIAQPLRDSLSVGSRFLEILGEAQADKKEQEKKAPSVVHDRDSRSVEFC